MAFSSNSSELFDENLTLEANLKRLAKTKAQAILSNVKVRNKKRIIILGADTVVCLGTRVLGKPKNRHDASRMLALLSGKKHRVKTSFALFNKDKNQWISKVVSTVVGFRKLSKEEIKWYVSTGEPFDKAGSYAIQGHARAFVNYVEGDILNVIGLPLDAVREQLRKHGWNIGLSNPAKSRKYSRENSHR
jgi:septum formation protein